MFSIVLLSLVALGAEAEWQTPYGPGFGRGRAYPWTYPHHQQNQINSNSEEIEWVCQNPKTNDIMIIASENAQQQHPPQHPPQQPQYPNRQPWWHDMRTPPGHQNHHPQQQPENHWTIFTDQATREGTHQFPTTEIPHTNNPQINNPHTNNPQINNPHTNNPQINNPHTNNPQINNPHINNPHTNNPQPETTPHYHGGEGLINIRLAD